MARMQLAVPAPLDYPDELREFLGREISTTTVAQLRSHAGYPYFVKPVLDRGWRVRPIP